MSTIKPRYSRVSDILDLAVFMSSKIEGVTIEQIEKRYNVSRRTAERMRDSLMSIFPQIDVIENDDNRKHWGFTNYSISALISFSAQEIAHIEQLQKQSPNSQAKEELLKIIEKIKTLNRKDLNNIQTNIELILQTEGFAVRQGPQFNIKPQIFDVVREAVRNSKMVTGVYHNKFREIEPLGIIYGEKIYLVAREKVKGDGVYNYLLHKFENLELSHKTFNKIDFNLQEYANLSFGFFHGEILDVELLFSQELAQKAKEYDFHPTQKIKQEKDGSLLVSFSASGPYQIMRHVFKWGPGCKILSPEKLKEQYKKYLQDNLENYL